MTKTCYLKLVSNRNKILYCRKIFIYAIIQNNVIKHKKGRLNTYRKRPLRSLNVHNTAGIP